MNTVQRINMYPLKNFRFALPKSLVLIMMSLVFIISSAQAGLFDPGPGKTLLLIGQTFKKEFDDYITGIRAPAGSSHYGTIFWGTIEQGDDGPNNTFLTYVHNKYNGVYALVALSIKDNFGAGGFGSVEAACQAIANGQLNSQIDKYCSIMKAHPKMKFLVRIGYEVSLFQFGSAQIFIKAYNHIADRIRNTNGVTNADFVYHPVRGYNDATEMYPGDQNVDWIALSIFNNDVCLPCDDVQNCPGERIDPNLKMVFEWGVEKGKPLMIAESAVQQPAGGTVEGFSDYLDRVEEAIEAYDIRCWVYINSDWPGHSWPANIWSDSRVEARGDAIKQKWLSIVNKPRYIHYDELTPIANHNLLPASDKLSPMLGNTKIEWYSMNGKLVYTITPETIKEAKKYGHRKMTRGFHENLPEGLYLLKFISLKQVLYQKMLYIP